MRRCKQLILRKEHSGKRQIHMRKMFNTLSAGMYSVEMWIKEVYKLHDDMNQLIDDLKKVNWTIQAYSSVKLLLPTQIVMMEQLRLQKA